jgi:hypothetical protein
MYKTAAWRRRRAQQLAEQPLCERCLAKGLTVIATVAHHVVRHDGDWDSFINGKLASSCAPCHDVVERGIEERGYEIGNDVNGRPTAADHPWNRPRG